MTKTRLILGSAHAQRHSNSELSYFLPIETTTKHVIQPCNITDQLTDSAHHWLEELSNLIVNQENHMLKLKDYALEKNWTIEGE